MKRLFLFFSILTLVFFACMSDDEDKSIYSMVIKGYDGASLTTFTGNYMLLDGSENWKTYRVLSDSVVVELSDTGVYILNATKAGFSSEPDVDTVTISDLYRIGRPVFYFSEDTTGTETDFLITVNGSSDGNPVAFSGDYKMDNPDSGWHAFSVGSSGSTVIPVSSAGDYVVRAEKSGYTVSPSELGLSLTTISPEASANFAFVDTSSTVVYYTLNIEGNIAGSATSFVAEYRHSSTSTWTSLSVGSSGSTSLTFETAGNYYIRAFKDGHTASPESNLVTFDGSTIEATSVFTFTEVIPDEYFINISGTSEGSPTSFTGKYKMDAVGAVWTEISVGSSGSNTAVLSEGGTYLVQAVKDGFSCSPTEESITLTPSNFEEDVNFTFIDTTGGTTYYTLNIEGDIAGSSTSFLAEYRHSSTSTWTSISVGSSGSTSLTLETAGEYNIRASKDGYTVSPTSDIVTFDGATIEATSSFTFTEETAEEYFIHFVGEIDGERTAFTGRYRLDIEGSGWHEIEVGGSGTASASVSIAGTYIVQGIKDGYFSTEMSVTLTSEIAYAYANFDFTLEADEYYIHFIGEVEGERTAFTGRYKLDESGSAWSEIEISGSGTASATVYSAGTYIVQGIKAGHYSMEQTIELDPEHIYEYVTFEFVDTTGMEFYLHLIGEIYGTTDRTSFTADYKLSSDDFWTSVDVGGSGTESALLPVPGTYYVKGNKPAHITYPETDTVTIDFETTYAYSTFEFRDTTGITTDGVQLIVADSYNHRIVRFNDMECDGWISYGSNGSDIGQFNFPYGMDLIEETGQIFIADAYNQRIVRLDNLFGSGWLEWNGSDSPGGALANATDVKIGPDNKIYIVDFGNHRLVRIDNMEGDGWVSFGSFGDGLGQFNKLHSVDFDDFGRIYISDLDNSRVVRIDNMTGAGWTTFGTYGSGIGHFARLVDVHIGHDNKIYLGDYRNYRIVRIDDMSGAGWIEYSDDLDEPTRIVTDTENRIYIADKLNHRIVRIDNMTGAGRISLGVEGAGECEFYRPLSIFIKDTRD